MANATLLLLAVPFLFRQARRNEWTVVRLRQPSMLACLERS